MPRFTRGWIAWANALLGELVLDVGRRMPGLRGRPLPA
jgi:meiotically up-regulated gene 157 (Mug157) protein